MPDRSFPISLTFSTSTIEEVVKIVKEILALVVAVVVVKLVLNVVVLVAEEVLLEVVIVVITVQPQGGCDVGESGSASGSCISKG